MKFIKGGIRLPPPWCKMSEPESEYTPTIEGRYQMLQVPPHIPGGQRAYYEQRRRVLITELRALDTLLGRRQTIPRKE